MWYFIISSIAVITGLLLLWGYYKFFNKKQLPIDNNSLQKQPNVRSIVIEEIERILPNYEVIKWRDICDYTKGIESIYNFPLKDYENQGYNDALVNPDDSYKMTNIDLIKNDLQILIRKVRSGYENKMRDIDFYIALQNKQGLMNLVEKLQIIKEKILSHIEEIKGIENDLESNQGNIYRDIFFAYQKGFARGISSLTQSAIYTPLRLDLTEKTNH